MTYIVDELKVVDTLTGCGGSLRVSLFNEFTGEIRVAFLDLEEMFLGSLPASRAHIDIDQDAARFRDINDGIVRGMVEAGRLSPEGEE